VDARDEVVRIAVAVGDASLAKRVVAALAASARVRLVPAGEEADVVVTATMDEGSGAVRATDEAAVAAQLTRREREVLALLAEGASNKTIARRLGISVHTAKFHVASLLDKLDATGRTDAVMHAARLRVIEL
jgi:DNA-binding CsgD family transcriptional regulator